MWRETACFAVIASGRPRERIAGGGRGGGSGDEQEMRLPRRRSCRMVCTIGSARRDGAVGGGRRRPTRPLAGGANGK